jgi:hypothetical protein
MIRNWWARLRGPVTHEWTLAALAAVAVALLINRGALADPAHTLPRDIWDPSYHAYLLAWGGYALRHDPFGIWHFNAFYPAPYGLAFSDSLLGYAPFGLVGTGPEAAVLRYNVVYIGAYALVLFGGYALARQLGLRPVAAALVGVALAVAPWRLSHTGHLNVLSTGGIFLALAMLARGHGVRWRRADPSADDGAGRPPYRPGWAFAGWVLAAWQVSLGFAIGLPFLYLLVGIVAVAVALRVWRHRDDLRQRAWRSVLPPRALLLSDLAGGLVLSASSILLAWPYLRVLEIYPHFRRDVSWIELYSPPLRGLFIAPGESIIWGNVQEAARSALLIPGEMARLPGFTLYALAAVGLFVSVWSVGVRLSLAVAAVVTATLTLGTNGPAGGELGYLLLLHLPGFDGIRTPGRMILWTTLALALLAGGAVGAGAQALRAAADRGEPRLAEKALTEPPLTEKALAPDTRARSWPGQAALARIAMVVPVVIVFAEGAGDIPHPEMPAAPAALSYVEPPTLVLPMHEVMDTNVTLWTTDRFAPVVNGGTSQTPTEQIQVREAIGGFPDYTSVEHLRAIGVRSVVVLRDRAGGTPYASADVVPIDGLPLVRHVYADTVVFTILS